MENGARYEISLKTKKLNPTIWLFVTLMLQNDGQKFHFSDQSGESDFVRY